MDFEELFSQLEKNKVNYVICGGLAVALYGIPRMTFDIDLIIEMEKQNLLQFEKTMNELGYQSILPFSLNQLIEKESISDLIKDKNLIAFGFFNTTRNKMNIDVLVDIPVSYEKISSNRVHRQIGKTDFYLIGIDELIELKKYANRMQDKKDIEQLMELKKKKNQDGI